MKPHAIKRVLSEIALIGLFVAPILIIVLALIGLGIYAISGDHETALWICGIAFGAFVVLSPIAFRVLSQPDTREACDCGDTRRRRE